MSINITEVLPVLDTILRQQQAICAKLKELAETFSVEPEPVEPALRQLLQPLADGVSSLEQALPTPTKPS